jgi:predicted HTH domain antitoxin
MTIEISDQLISQTGKTEADVRLQIAIALFQDDFFSLGQAAEFAKIHQIQLQRILAKNRIELHYGEQEFSADLKTIERLQL